MERGLEMEQKFPTGKVGDHSLSKQRGELRRYYKEQGRVTCGDTGGSTAI